MPSWAGNPRRQWFLRTSYDWSYVSYGAGLKEALASLRIDGGGHRLLLHHYSGPAHQRGRQLLVRAPGYPQHRRQAGHVRLQHAHGPPRSTSSSPRSPFAERAEERRSTRNQKGRAGSSALFPRSIFSTRNRPVRLWAPSARSLQHFGVPRRPLPDSNHRRTCPSGTLLLDDGVGGLGLVQAAALRT